MSDQPTSETLRLVEGRESNRCIVCDRYLRAGNWPGMSHHHRKRRSQTYGDPERHSPSNVIDDRWITGHIRDHVPVGTFTDAMRADFWASVKTGIDPEQKAKEIINECQRKASR